MATALDATVLVAVLKDVRDFRLLRRKHWYRIPAAHAPRRAFGWLAFYQPAGFGRSGKRIRWCAPVLGRTTVLRRTLLPGEPHHPRANDPYVRLTTGSLLPLPAPVLNRTPRRITFAFTTLRKLFGARDLTAVFRAAPIERLMSGALRRAHVPALREFHVAGGALGRFRLDFAVFCERGAIAVECDGNSSHRGPAAARTDRAKTAALTRLGWRVMRFSEDAIVRDARTCAARVRATARALGGIVRQTSAGAASPR